MNKGFIKISDELYKNEWSNLYIFMKEFRPTHIEFRHWEDNTWYMYGVSEKFEPIKEGDAIPRYDVLFTMGDDGAYTYYFKKI